MPYLHLPVQSGSTASSSDEPRTPPKLRPLIERIRAARPDILISGDFIVGFPEETEADFRATLALIEEVHYGSGLLLQVFDPPRHARGRARSGRPEDVADPTGCSRLQALLTRQQRAAQDAMVGRDVTCSSRSPAACPGRWSASPSICTPCTSPDAAAKRGELAAVRIVESGPNSLPAAGSELRPRPDDRSARKPALAGQGRDRAPSAAAGQDCGVGTTKRKALLDLARKL